MRFDLVIFDNDGVLVDSEPIACDVLASLLTEYGLPTSFDDVIHDYLGGSITRTRKIAEERLGRALPEDLEARFHQGLFQRFKAELKPMAGVEETLDGIRAETCVASSGSHERIRQSLMVTKLLDRFEGRIYSASDVEHGKPAPDLFLHAAANMGAPPNRCVVVEDSPLGIEAARRAEMPSIGFANLQEPEKLHGATEGVITRMQDLLDLVN